MRKERNIVPSSIGYGVRKQKPQRFFVRQVAQCEKNLLTNTRSALARTPLGSVSPDLWSGANQCPLPNLRSSTNHMPLPNYSSTNTKMSVLYFFTIFVIFLEAA